MRVVRRRHDPHERTREVRGSSTVAGVEHCAPCRLGDGLVATRDERTFLVRLRHGHRTPSVRGPGCPKVRTLGPMDGGLTRLGMHPATRLAVPVAPVVRIDKRHPRRPMAAHTRPVQCAYTHRNACRRRGPARSCSHAPSAGFDRVTRRSIGSLRRSYPHSLSRLLIQCRRRRLQYPALDLWEESNLDRVLRCPCKRRGARQVRAS